MLFYQRNWININQFMSLIQYHETVIILIKGSQKYLSETKFGGIHNIEICWIILKFQLFNFNRNLSINEIIIFILQYLSKFSEDNF